MDSDLVVARASGVIMHEGRRHPIRRGVTVARAGHPLVVKSPKHWQPLRVHYDLPNAAEEEPTAAPASGVAAVTEQLGGVEQATAAPGELRDVQPAQPVDEPVQEQDEVPAPDAEPAPEAEEPAPAPEADQEPAVEEPRRPPTSGPGSGVGAWRQHAAEVTSTPVEQWADKSRDDIRRELYGDAE